MHHRLEDKGLRVSVRSLVVADHPVDAAVGNNPHDGGTDEARYGNAYSGMSAPLERQGAEGTGEVEPWGHLALDVSADRLS
jgi:hypothetical protein